MRQQDGTHGSGAALVVHRLRREVGHDLRAGNGLQRIAHRHETRRQELQIVVRQQNDLRLAVKFGADVGGSARADVASDAVHLGVGRVLVSAVFRFHRRVAGLAAERIHFHQVIGLIAAESGKENKAEATTDKGD